MDGGDVDVAPGTSPGRATGYGATSGRRPQSWATSGGEMDGGDVAVAPGTSPGRATGYGATSGGDVPGLRPGGEMDGGDIAAAQEHRYVRPAPDPGLRPGGEMDGLLYVGRRNGRRRCRRSPRNIATSGRGRNPGLRPGGEMDGGDIAAAQEHRYVHGGDVAVAQEHRYVRPAPDPGLRPGGEMDGGDIAVAQEHRYVHGGDVAVAPGTSPGRATGYGATSGAGSWATSGGEMDGGDIAAAQEHRPAGLRAMALRPAAMFLGYVRRRNGRRRCRRSPRNIATSGRGRNPGLRPGGEMDGGDVAVAPGTSLRPGAAAILGYVRAAKWTAAMSP